MKKPLEYHLFPAGFERGEEATRSHGGIRIAKFSGKKFLKNLVQQKAELEKHLRGRGGVG